MGFVTLKTIDGRFVTVHANSLPQGGQYDRDQRTINAAARPPGATGVGQGAEGARPAGPERQRCRHCGSPIGDSEA